jgi:hypothetical protein
MAMNEKPQECCANCAHFRNDPEFIELAFRGLSSLSSARGSVRADDGICLRHDRYLSARASCAAFRFTSKNGKAAGARAGAFAWKF